MRKRSHIKLSTCLLILLVSALAIGFAGRTTSGNSVSWPADESGPLLADPETPAAPAATKAPEQPVRTGVRVFWLPIRDDITDRMAIFVKSTIKKAKEANAEYIILDLDTYGGEMKAMDDICSELISIDSKKIHTVAFVNDKAESAGAFISLACDRIVMAPSGTIGSAMPILVAPGQLPQSVSEKQLSYARERIRALATTKGHNPDLAEAMVYIPKWVVWVEVKKNGNVIEHRVIDKDNLEKERLEASKQGLEFGSVEDIDTDEKLLNLSADRAVKYGLAEAMVSDKDELFRYLGLKDPEVMEYKPNISEALYNVLTSPFVTIILLLLAIGGIYLEATTPGVIIPGIVGVSALVLLLSIGFIIDTANIWTVLMVFAGLVLLALEILVIPSFGVVGVLGILLVLAGITLSLVPTTIPRTPWETSFLLVTLRNVLFGVVAGVIAVIISIKVMPRTPGFKRLTLHTVQSPQTGYTVTAEVLQPLMGKTGVVVATCRPAGKAEFGDTLVDVVCEGEVIEIGQKVQVTEITGNRVVVKKV